MTAIRNKQSGAALVIGLILLVVITLLAVVGMNIANTELASATSEQLRLRAFNAAETGLEATMQTLADVADTDPTPIEDEAVGVENSPLNTVTEDPADTYSVVTTYRGEGNMISRFSAGTFVGFHYSVEVTGRSARNAESVHTAGAVLIRGVGEDNQQPPVTEDQIPVVGLPEGGLGSVSPVGSEPPATP